MGKIKKSFFCQHCGAQHVKWQGQCSTCKEWNTLIEEVISPQSTQNWGNPDQKNSSPQKALEISEIKNTSEPRIDSFDKELNKSFSIYGEYNFARDDDKYNDDIQEIIYRKGNGYLNAGLRWSATDNLMLEINVNDMSKNDRNSDAMNRELKIIYFEQF